MNRPAEVQRLIEDLGAEKPHSSVISQDDSRLIVTVEDPQARYEFSGPEAKLLLASPNTVERLFEALDYPEETFIDLHSMVVDEEITSALESYSATVDET